VSGFGEIDPRDDAVFHERWEARAFGLLSLTMALGLCNLDRSRRAIEAHDHDEYLRLGYYGRWLEAAVRILEEARVLAPGELDARVHAVEARIDPRPASPVEPLAPPDEALFSARRAGTASPRFEVGDPVRVRDVDPHGHTRLPGYARGKRGSVARCYGGWVFPDTHARGEGENPQNVYCIRFEASELWGDEGEPGTCIHIDLFESYLEPRGRGRKTA